MQSLDHENIIKFYEQYSDEKYNYICMELCEGLSLYDKIIKTKIKISEKEAANYCF